MVATPASSEKARTHSGSALTLRPVHESMKDRGGLISASEWMVSSRPLRLRPEMSQ